MDLKNKIVRSAMIWGTDYFGVADLTSARNTILEQGGTEVAEYPRSISIGIALLHPIVNQLLRRSDRSVAVNYRSHCYDIINARLDEIISRLASVLQREGYRAFPVPASKRVDDDQICAIFSHKLSAHLAGLGWIGKNYLLITPDMGPRVRWATVLTDAHRSVVRRLDIANCDIKFGLGRSAGRRKPPLVFCCNTCSPQER